MQSVAMVALVVRNWLFGWYIVEQKQGAACRIALYGKQMMQRLSDELVARGVQRASPTSLRQFRAFYLAF